MAPLNKKITTNPEKTVSQTPAPPTTDGLTPPCTTSSEQEDIRQLESLLEDLLKKRSYEAAVGPLRRIVSRQPGRSSSFVMDMEKLAAVLRNAGHQLYYDSSFEQAKQRFLEAEEIFASLGRITEIYKIRTARARCESSLGNFQEAARLLKKLIRYSSDGRYMKRLSACDKNFNPREATAKNYYYLSIALAKQNLWREALSAARSAARLSSDPDYKNLALWGEGLALLEIKKFHPALKKLRLARKYFSGENPDRAVLVDESIARCLHRLGQNTGSLRLLDGCIKYLSEKGIRRDWVYFHRGVTKESLGDADGADADYLKAVELVETTRGEIHSDPYRRSYFAQKLIIYDYAILNAFINRNDIRTAFDLAQRAKSRSFNEQVERAGTTRDIYPADDKIVRQLLELRKKIDRQYAEGESADTTANDWRTLGQLQNLYARLLHRIEERNPRAAQMVISGSLSVEEIRDLLNPGDAFIEYYSVGNKLLIFCVTKEKGLSGASADFPKKDLAGAVSSLQLWAAGIENSVDEKERKLKLGAMEWYSRFLADLLITPIEKHIADAQRLIISPHLSLHYLPFSMLKTSDGKFVVERYELATVPSSRLIKKQSAGEKIPPARSLIVADTLGDLKHAGMESEKISAILPSPVFLKGTAATKSRLLADLGNFDIIHFACHARACPETPLFSGIAVCGDDSGRRAFIEANEILRINVKASLVFLCGCSTGIGDVPEGDEITSLARSFIIAGASSAVYTLWDVSDESASEFAWLFYDGLITGKKSPAAALRTAQIKMLSDNRSPYHWAPFAIAGL